MCEFRTRVVFASLIRLTMRKLEEWMNDRKETKKKHRHFCSQSYECTMIWTLHTWWTSKCIIAVQCSLKFVPISDKSNERLKTTEISWFAANGKFNTKINCTWCVSSSPLHYYDITHVLCLWLKSPYIGWMAGQRKNCLHAVDTYFANLMISSRYW